METGDPVGSNSRIFTIHLNHDGNFGEWSYYNGEVVSMDFDVDMVSLVRIDVWVKYLGHRGNMIYYWRQPGKDFNNGLKVLENDACVYEMALHAIDDGDGAVDVYVRHLSEEELEKVVNPVRKSSVVIEEIEEEDVSNNVGNVHKGCSVGRKDNNDKLNTALTKKLLGSSGVGNAHTKNMLIDGANKCVNLEDSGSDTEEQPEIEQIIGNCEREEEAVNICSGSEFHNEGEGSDSESSEFTDDSEHETDEGETESESEYEEDEVTEAPATVTNEPSHVGVVPDPTNRNIIEDSDFDIVDGDDDLQDVLRETGQLNENGVLVDVPVGGVKRSMGGRPKGNDEGPSCSGLDASLRFEVEEGSSDYGPDSDEIVTASESGSDAEMNNKPKLKYPRFNAERNMRNPKFEMGMLFKNKDEFKDACKQWGIKNRWQVHFPVNDAIRCRCKCYKNCSFWIYASKVDRKCKEDKTFQIRSFNLKHTCAKGKSNFHVTSKYLAQKYLEEFRDDPQWNLKAFMNRVKKDIKMTIDRMKAWRARDYAVKKIIGDEDQQYSRLYDYKLELLRTNPGSTIEFKEPRGRFEGMYVCVGALKDAFKSGCRNLICLNGCFLKGTYGGQLLSATGIDPNDCMFPLAFAIVKVENTENWDWFLELIREDFQINNSYHWVFMSDRQKDSSWIDRAFCSQNQDINATVTQATQGSQTSTPVQDKGKGVKRKNLKGRDVPSRYKPQKK